MNSKFEFQSTHRYFIDKYIYQTLYSTSRLLLYGFNTDNKIGKVKYAHRQMRKKQRLINTV